MEYRKTNGALEREGLLGSSGEVMRDPTTPTCICFVSVVKGGNTDQLEGRREVPGSPGERACPHCSSPRMAGESRLNCVQAPGGREGISVLPSEAW